MTNKNSDHRHQLSFRRFWIYCAAQLGSGKLSLQHKAGTLGKFCGSTAVIPEPLGDAIRESYKRSACQNLDSRICLDSTLDVLGELAYSLKGKDQDDLLTIELLEEVGWCICQIYKKESGTKSSDHELLILEAERGQNSAYSNTGAPRETEGILRHDIVEIGQRGQDLASYAHEHSQDKQPLKHTQKEQTRKKESQKRNKTVVSMELAKIRRSNTSMI
ncbi:MAG: hypothetical protein AAF197_11070 [Pseudomonadota bacterium]